MADSYWNYWSAESNESLAETIAISLDEEAAER